MSLWGFDGVDNSLVAWSSLSQFDEMLWTEFGESNGDHVVPNPSSPQSNGDRRKRTQCESSLSGSIFKGASATSVGVAGSASELSSDIENRSEQPVIAGNATVSEGGWTGLGSVSLDLTTESEPFCSDLSPASQETDDTGDEVAKDQTMSTTEGDAQLYTSVEDASMVTDPFPMSEVGSENGGLEIFGSENVVSKADTLLELGWENISNLDDMDKLFRNDSSFEPVLVNGTKGLDWPSSSSPPAGPVGRGNEFENPACVSELIAAKAEEVELEDKKEVVFDGRLQGLVMDSLDDVVADFGSQRSPIVLAGASVEQHSLPREDKRVELSEAKSAHMTDGTGVSKGSVPEAEKVSMAQAYRVRRHAVNRKRHEDRFKRTTAYRKLSPGPPYNVHVADARKLQTLPLTLPGQPPLLQPVTTFPLQYFPPTTTPGMIGAPHQLHISRGVPYIHLAYPVQNVPAISSSPSIPLVHMQHPQSMFVDIHEGGSQGQRQPLLLPQASALVSSWPVAVSNRPPTSSQNMTPQEKMEKLRWRQQMQARIAVEQQQHQLLASPNGHGIDPMDQKHQVLLCHNVVPNQSRRTLTFTSDAVMNPLEANQTLVVKEGDLPSSCDKGDTDCSLEGSVLCQLKSTVSALDVGTRLCIRDALYRLARSAMKRRAAGTDNLNGSQGSKEQDSDVNAVESSTASGPQSSGRSKATSMSVVETETNPIDRSIAKLLFSKPQPQLFGRSYAYT